MKRVINVFLAVLVLLTSVNTVFADSFNAVVESKEANAGEEVEIKISLENNTGIIAAIFDLTYDNERLDLIEVKDGKLLEGGVFSSNYKAYPYKMVWNSSSFNNFAEDGTLVTLKFKVVDNAKSGKAFINIDYDADDVYDVDLNNVNLTVKNGEIQVSGTKVDETDKDTGSGSSGARRPAGIYGGSTPPGVTTQTETIDNTKNQIVLTIGKKEAMVFGEIKVNDVAPVIRNDRTMLPARFVAENLGALVEWDETAPGYVTITKGETKIVITIDSQTAVVNGETIVLDSLAFIENDRTYTPLRFIAEKLGASVDWKEDTQEVIITMK